MPRKERTLASAAQNRDSQRRSRARRQAYVEQLEQQLAQYRQAEVQATHHVQQAAQLVDVENQRLRAENLRLKALVDRLEESLATISPSGQATPHYAVGHPEERTLTPVSYHAGESNTRRHASSKESQAQLIPNEIGLEDQGSPSALSNSTHMSCKEAAGILATLNGNTDTHKALHRLNCKEGTECYVKTTKLFELID